MRGTGSYVVVAAFLLVAFAPGTLAQGSGQYVPHPPISIESDGDFSAPGNGVVSGSGSEDDPYVIEGWQIDTRVWPANQAIFVDNTSAFFVVRDVRLVGPEGGGIGVELRNVTNAAFVQMETQGGFSGFTLIDSTHVGLSNVTISTSYGWGIQALRVASVTVGDVRVVDPPPVLQSGSLRAAAVAFHDADNVSMSRLVVEDEDAVRDAGIRISEAHSVGLFESRITGSPTALHLADVHNATLADNRLQGAMTAVELWGPGTVTSQADTFVGGREDVVEVHQASFAMRGGHVVGGDLGVVAFTESVAVLEDCVVAGTNATGIQLLDVVDSRVAGCTVTDNGRHGVMFYGERTVVRNSTFTDNAGYGVWYGGDADGANGIENNDFANNRLGDIYIDGRVGNTVVAGNNGTVERDHDVFEPAPGAGAAIVGVLAAVFVARRRR